MRGPALAVSNNGTELREQLADQSPWFRCGQRPPPLLPSSGLASLSPCAGRFLPQRPRLGGAVSPGSPGKFARGLSAAGSRQPGSLWGAPGLVALLLEKAWKESFCSELVTVAGWRLLPHYAPGLLVCGEADGGEVGSGDSGQT